MWEIFEEEERHPGGPGFRIVTLVKNREIARTTYRIVTWGEDADGEIYFCDFTGGGIYQLVKAPDAKPQATFPRKLSETGIFASTKDHKVAPGVIPYSVNAQLWGDHAYKERFIAIPGNGQIGFDEIELSAALPRRSPRLALPRWHRPGENLRHGNGTRQS